MKPAQNSSRNAVLQARIGLAVSQVLDLPGNRKPVTSVWMLDRHGAGRGCSERRRPARCRGRWYQWPTRMLIWEHGPQCRVCRKWGVVQRWVYCFPREIAVNPQIIGHHFSMANCPSTLFFAALPGLPRQPWRCQHLLELLCRLLSRPGLRTATPSLHPPRSR